MFVERQLTVLDRVVNVDLERYILMMSMRDYELNIAPNLSILLTAGRALAISWKMSRSQVSPLFGSDHGKFHQVEQDRSVPGCITPWSPPR